MNIKIAVLIPRSDMFQTLGFDFLNGLKLSLQNHFKQMPQLIIESVGVASHDEIVRVSEKLILQENIALTIAFCGINSITPFVELQTNYKKPILFVDLGANVLKKEHANPYVLHHTLNLWQANYAMGMYAVQNFGKKISVAVSFYDGGYQHTAAFVQGVEAGGGEVSSFYVSPQDYKTETFDTLIEQTSQANPDALFLLFSFKEGVKVFEKIATSKLNKNLPIITGPLMTDKTINVIDYGLENVHSMASWSFNEDTPAMKMFVKNYFDVYANKPTLFGLLGFEVGQTIEKCKIDDTTLATKIKDKVAEVSIKTPRGEVQYNAYNESEITGFKLRKFKFQEGHYINEVIEHVTLEPASLYEVFEEAPYSGWKNPYICT